MTHVAIFLSRQQMASNPNRNGFNINEREKQFQIRFVTRKNAIDGSWRGAPQRFFLRPFQSTKIKNWAIDVLLELPWSTWHILQKQSECGDYHLRRTTMCYQTTILVHRLCPRKVDHGLLLNMLIIHMERASHQENIRRGRRRTDTQLDSHQQYSHSTVPSVQEEMVSQALRRSREKKKSIFAGEIKTRLYQFIKTV